jgi:hypothetical protein
VQTLEPFAAGYVQKTAEQLVPEAPSLICVAHNDRELRALFVGLDEACDADDLFGMRVLNNKSYLAIVVDATDTRQARVSGPIVK